MQFSKPLLTISIPTYNRCFYLDELLASLFEQVRHSPEIELIISDNASTDNTLAIVEKYQNQGLAIRYLLNSKNLGADGNILQCFKEANGKYVWIIGDDDFIAPETVNKLTEYLRLDEFDLIYIDSYLFTKQTYFPRRQGAKEPHIVTNARTFVRYVNINLTFISGSIINKDQAIKSGMEGLSGLIGSSLVQLGWICAALNGYTRGLIIPEKLVGMRTNNTGGYRLLQTFGPNLNSITIQWLRDQELSKMIINGALMRFWPGMLVQVRKNPQTFESEQPPSDVLGPVFRENFRYWVFIYPILVFPYSFSKLWLMLVRIMNKLDRETGSSLIW